MFLKRPVPSGRDGSTPAMHPPYVGGHQDTAPREGSVHWLSRLKQEEFTMVGFSASTMTALREHSAEAPGQNVPLLQTGPGGSYGRAYFGRGRRLVASAPLPNLQRTRRRRITSLLLGPQTLLERLLGIDHCSTDIDRAGQTFRSGASCGKTGDEHASTIDEYVFRCTPTADDVHAVCMETRRLSDDDELLAVRNMDLSRTLPITRVQPIARMDTPYECHTKATSDTQPDPGLSSRQRLFADDAGTGRRNWGQQGHGVRTRRSTRSKGRHLARAEQGSLFVDL